MGPNDPPAGTPRTAGLVLSLPGNEPLGATLGSVLDAEVAAPIMRSFPDGELYVRIREEVRDRDVVLAATLHRPDRTVLPLLACAATARDLGARTLGLVAPYLAYMRQDARFHPGEGVTARYFAKLLSSAVDWIVTADPHLHRLGSLDEVYRIPTRLLRTAPLLAAWVVQHVDRPLIIGPDAESAQWAEAVAAGAGCPCLVLEKVRSGDRDVAIVAPELRASHAGRIPVLVDDIISTGRTMIETIAQLRQAGLPPPICLGIHAVFAEGAHEELVAAGAARVVTTDTITHPTNAIAVGRALAEAVDLPA